jgi:3-oxoadipate enol-lactonase
MFLRDSGGAGPTVLLLHGWMASADLNWSGAYQPLSDAGYRVLAPDHRGHGRGIRPLTPFTLLDCAADAAGLLQELAAAPATVVGYSMGGAIASLLARDFGELVRGLVLSGTAPQFASPQMRRTWRGMAALQAALQVAPYATWRRGLAWTGVPDTPASAWLMSELLRASPRDVAEAGRELGRFNSLPWLGSLTMPAAVIVTSRDTAVSPAHQRKLADALNAQVFEAPIDHLEVTSRTDEFNAALLAALEAVGARAVAKAA